MLVGHSKNLMVDSCQLGTALAFPQDMDRRYVSGAGALGHSDSGVGYLAGAGLAPKLGHRFVDHSDA